MIFCRLLFSSPASTSLKPSGKRSEGQANDSDRINLGSEINSATTVAEVIMVKKVILQQLLQK
ncbi:hypothetical protein AWN68_01295 [Roseivirga echinicomitans]|uniref:Uncharacterized protein n=1 Tax=Roseivirga echinicomitans TaxID=296218 RepID=A0A150XXH2_9BACT|nr:hypothetical protein AWN68_01295 [Roseivirga echinicomitans]